jgi:hypothetical protein
VPPALSDLRKLAAVDIEDKINEYVGRISRWSNPGMNTIIRQTNEAAIRVYRTAPRDIHKLKMAIALKTKGFNNCRKWPERDILKSELDAMVHIRDMIMTENELT